MDFGISHVVLEMGIKFKVSPDVTQLIIKRIDELFVKPGLNKYLPNHFFTIYVVTSRKRTKLEVSGPVEKEDFIEYTLHMPYIPIVDAEDLLEAYLETFFDGLKIVLAHYKVSKEDLDEALEEIKKEVLNNSAYEYEEIYNHRTSEELGQLIKSLQQKNRDDKS